MSMELVCGIGVNDADYPLSWRDESGAEVRCPYYAKWRSMIDRCYSAKSLSKNPQYKNVRVCKKWLTFSKFKSWMEKQDWKGKHLDKDFLSFGKSKIYSPETCAFITQTTNTFTAMGARNKKCKRPAGVEMRRKGNYRVKISNPISGERESISGFSCENEAHQAWRKRKLEIAKMLAEMETDKRVSKVLVEMYS